MTEVWESRRSFKSSKRSVGKICIHKCRIHICRAIDTNIPVSLSFSWIDELTNSIVWVDERELLDCSCFLLAICIIGMGIDKDMCCYQTVEIWVVGNAKHSRRCKDCLESISPNNRWCAIQKEIFQFLETYQIFVVCYDLVRGCLGPECHLTMTSCRSWGWKAKK